jgi:hypothetical protein
MSRTILALSTAALLCASSQIAFADESGAITGGVGGAVAGAVIGGPVGAVVGGVGGAAIGNSVTNHRQYHRGYGSIPITTTTINTDRSATASARTSSEFRICHADVDCVERLESPAARKFPIHATPKTGAVGAKPSQPAAVNARRPL